MLIRLGADDGFSLIELLTAMLVGIVVIFGAFSVIDNSARSTARSRGEPTRRNVAARHGRDHARPALGGLRQQHPSYHDGHPDAGRLHRRPVRRHRLPEQRQFTYTATADTITQSVVAGSGTANAVTVGRHPQDEARAHQ